MTTREEFYPVIHWFANEMDREMSQPENLVKGHWRDEPSWSLANHLYEEYLELEYAVMFESPVNYDAIISEAADLANIAMMIADNARQAKEKERLNAHTTT